jgi:hypothetical protein
MRQNTSAPSVPALPQKKEATVKSAIDAAK